jgi:formylglycine-generating enzyme required for sulfatase activity
VPNANIVFGGSGASRTVTVTPASGQSGTATITVTVSDGSLSTSDTFVLTVNSAPTITDIATQWSHHSQIPGAISFTIEDAQTAASFLTLSASSSNTTLVPSANIVFGGSDENRSVTVTPAIGQSGTATITVTVSDGTLSSSDTFDLVVDSEFAYVIGGSLPSSSKLGSSSVKSFYISKTETTWARWKSVVTGSWGNGYDLNLGYAERGFHPVTQVSWYDVVKWCNARSEQEGLTPVYKVNGEVYKKGNITPTVDATANGYRLPTEAEWEFAARGGVCTQNYEYSGANDIDLVAWYNGNSGSYMSIVRQKQANELGLYDMTGNVLEWCEDSLYGWLRVARGGSYANVADDCRIAHQTSHTPDARAAAIGFRFARSSVSGEPTISDIAAQSVTVGNNTGAIAFTIGDDLTSTESLILTGRSSNTSLVPNANIVFSGSGANRTVLVTPTSGQSGMATITVIVSDGMLSSSDTFVLEVTNTAPTISDIQDLDIVQGSNTAEISFQINDIENGFESLILSASSSHSDIIPNANIVFSGSGGNRTVKITPLSGQIGYTWITLTVSDGLLTSSDTFLITVNSPPSISDILDQIVNQDSDSDYIEFTIYDTNTDPEMLKISAISNNTTLVPNENIVIYKLSGGRCALRVFTNSGKSGTAIITVTVSDGSLSASDIFSITTNTPPEISDVEDRVISINDGAIDVFFSVNDINTGSENLTMSAISGHGDIIPNANIIFGGSGENRTVKINPLSGRDGYALITLTVSDGLLNSSDTFLITVNSPPSISDISNQIVNQDSDSTNINFTIRDTLQDSSSLILSASSSNILLVPETNIVFGGSGASRTVTVTPASGQSGTAIITVTVSDGWLSASDTFSITTNTPPAISDIEDQEIFQDSSTFETVFSVNDSETGFQSLTLSASSSNTDLVPSANITFGGSGANRTVKVTPARGQIGAVTITVTVSDGLSITNDTFILSVNANTAPTISDIAALEITEGSDTGDLAFTVDDAQTAAGSLSVSGSSSNTTLVPNANIVFSGSGANRAVTVTPASGQSGTATITVTVSDGLLSSSDTFELSVNSIPTISDIAAQTINEGSSTSALAVTIGDAQTAAASLSVSGNSSNTTLVPNENIVFGGYGANRTVTVTPVSGQIGSATITVRVSNGYLTTSDTFALIVVPTPSGFTAVPAGVFTMGNSVVPDTDITDAPTRTVTLDAFFMGKYEVTKAEWESVRSWGLRNGYSDLGIGYFILGYKPSNHPVHIITWYDAVKWCNARSEKDGLVPVYYTNDAQTTIYKTGNVDVTNAQVKWNANGYRLPTEAEWEKGARGGLIGKRFPWGDTISHNQANYRASSRYAYDLSGQVNNYHPTYKTESEPYTSPVGSFAANAYGLHDMTGNVPEWCWDWYGAYTGSSLSNPRGTTSGAYRIFRGGGWSNFADYATRVASRGHINPTYDLGLGFRVLLPVNSTPTISDIAEQTINQGSSTSALTFTVGDAQSAAGLLSVSGNSSNTTLVPNANIVFGGIGADRTVTVSPASGQSGTATITVTVSDGSLSSSDTFVLKVNSLPTISNIVPQIINQDGYMEEMSFTVGDKETAANALSVSGYSSNTTLVPNTNIVFSGSGPNRAISVFPASGKSGSASITVTVSDGFTSTSLEFLVTVAEPEKGLAFVPAGAFSMGQNTQYILDAPTRTVTVDAFYISKYEVTVAEWIDVRQWAVYRGYSDLGEITNHKGINHPVLCSWSQAIKWCNARSQKEGLTPVYYTTSDFTAICKIGDLNSSNVYYNFNANGYRLPTEAEWEKAARGGLSGKEYPWGDTIDHSVANFREAYISFNYQLKPFIEIGEYHPEYYTFMKEPYTSPIGTFAANGYGLFDIAGNVSEWCWDLYGPYALGNQLNPRGPSYGSYRVHRGGCCHGFLYLCRVADRNNSYIWHIDQETSFYLPTNPTRAIGFRVVRNANP